jgi:hypothetical protein
VWRSRRNKDTGFSGNDLLFHPVTRAVPSALKSLASGFGMGPGVSSSLQSPEKPVVYVLRPKFRLGHHGTLKTEQSAFMLLWAIKPSNISTALLKALQPVHMPPINLVVSQGPYLLTQWVTLS